MKTETTFLYVYKNILNVVEQTAYVTPCSPQLNNYFPSKLRFNAKRKKAWFKEPVSAKRIASFIKLVLALRLSSYPIKNLILINSSV
jgi:hypothetical protein